MEHITKRVNAEDVARLAGVSKTAVSRAFAVDSSISADKRARVIAAAQKLGYRPNALARSLRTTRSNLIGVIFQEFTNPLILRIFDLITRRLQENGLHAVAVNAAKDTSLTDAMELVLQYRIDGLIVSSDIPLKIEYECAEMNVPVIVFARSDKRSANTFGVCLNDESVGRMAARHLVAQGYRNPAFLGGIPNISASVERQNGFMAGLAESGISLSIIEYAGGDTYDRGYEAGRRLLRETTPDAVFCVNDLVAIGLMDVAKTEFRMDIPSNLGIVGVDDIWVARTAQYDLTTIVQPLDEMVDYMMRLLQGDEVRATDVKSMLFEGMLVARGSTRRESKQAARR